MRAIVVQQPGGPEELVLSQVEEPQPGPGEVKISVRAAGVNRADILQRRGFYPPPKGITDILGLEVSGVVVGHGPDVQDSSPKVGDPVIALLAGGGYADFVVVPAGQCAPPPAGMDFTEDAAIMETSATVVSNFDHINVSPGETVLIHGGAGGIGSFAIPYAVHLGCRVITTVGSQEKAAYARSIGAETAIDYHGDWEAEVRDATAGKGVDAILDIMGAKYLEANVNLLARGGRMVVIGLQGGTKGTLDLNRLLSKGATITATSLRFRPIAEKSKIVSEVAQRIWPLFESGQIGVPPITAFPIDQATQAHQALESGANHGKIVLQLT